MIVKYDVFEYLANASVTHVCVNIIKEALIRKNCEVCDKEAFEVVKDIRGAVVITAIDVLRAKLSGYKEIIFWVQGVIPEESYCNHGSWLRKRVLEGIEKFALRNADKVLLVSQAMKEHYEEKYNLKLEKSYILPCFNESIDKSSFMYPDKYSKNTFVYVGGMSRWQCFDRIVQIYSSIEQRLEGTFLYIYTSGREEAQRIIDKYGIQNYLIEFVKQEELKERLKKVKFGFVIRDDIIVNKVATPTKLSNYMASGVIPIYSTCLTDFNNLMSNRKYRIGMHCGEELNVGIDEIIRWNTEEQIDAGAVLTEYNEIFDTYYSKEYHILQLLQFL